MLKSDLRREYRALRKSLSTEEVAEKSAAICKVLQERFLEGVRYVHVFLPISKNNEPDLWPLINYIHDERPEIQVVTSVSNPENRSMSHFLLKKGTELKTGALQIPEPINATPLKSDKIEMVLVPLLAYDSTGARVGYGQGYYDKFLASVPAALRVGISFFPPSEIITDAEAHDVRLDCCIFPEAVCFFEE